MKQSKKFKRLLSGMLSAVIAVSAVPIVSVHAEESTEPYPYTLFAASSDEGAITVNAGNFCVNGNVATNGTIVSSGNMNVNGTRTESAEESMIFIFDKIDNQYFSASNVDEHDADYTLDELNININVPTEVQGEATLTGNININNALKALEDVNLYGEVKNTNDSVIFSKYGDIVIDSQNVNLNGLVYAPFGSVTINAQNLNLNNVVIIAESIVLTCPNVNANNSSNASSFVGTVSEPLDIPYDEWQYMKDENENDFPDFFENLNNWNLLIDTDGDHLPNALEWYFETDSDNIDTDGDMLDDYYEIFTLMTDPTKVDTDDNGVSDFDEDMDGDNVSNGIEYKFGTNPEIRDTDRDNLTDGDEIYIYQTNPLNPDSDDDQICDGDEIVLGTDPNVLTQNTKDSFRKVFSPSDFGLSDDGSYPEIELIADAKGILTFKMASRGYDLNYNPLTPGYINQSVSLSTEGEFTTAILRYHVPDELLSDEGFTPAIYYFNEELGLLEELENTHLSGNVLTVELEHFSCYTMMNKQQFDARFRTAEEMYQYISPSDDLFSNDSYDTDLVFVLDDSGSMKTNDSSNMRKTTTSKFVEGLPETDNVALYSFTTGHPNFLLPLTQASKDGKVKFNQALNQLSSNGGTDGSQGLKAAVDLLSSRENIKAIIFFTDGSDTTTYYSYDKIISDAQENQITIFTIGLTNYVNEERLKKIANSTGGKFFSINDIDDLEDCYKKIRDLTIDYITDSNDDGISDYYTWKLCSGQMTDGYGNYVTPFGSPFYDENDTVYNETDYLTYEDCVNKVKERAVEIYNKVQQNCDFDNDGIKNGDEVIINRRKDFYTYAQLLSDPNNKDTDGDGLKDNIETTIGSDKNSFSVYCTENQITNLATSDYYIASYYKNQVLNGAMVNNSGLALAKLYSRNPKKEIYFKEVVDNISTLYNVTKGSYDNEDSMYMFYAETIKDAYVLERTFLTSTLIEDMHNAPKGFDVEKFLKALNRYRDAEIAKDGLVHVTREQMKQYCINFFSTPEFKEIDSEYYGISYLKPQKLKEGLMESFSNENNEKNLHNRGVDIALILFSGAIETIDTLDMYLDLMNCSIFFNDSVEILENIKANTNDSTLINTLDTVLDSLKSEKKLQSNKLKDAFLHASDEVIYQTIHSVISWTGSIGLTIEMMVGLGNLAGISETAEYTYRTCCSASMSDALSDAWSCMCKSKTHLSLTEDGWYTNDNFGSQYIKPDELIQYQQYVIALRLRSNENFITMENAGCILFNWLKKAIAKEALKTADIVANDLSYDRMKLFHQLVDSRVYDID